MSGSIPLSFNLSWPRATPALDAIELPWAQSAQHAAALGGCMPATHHRCGQSAGSRLALPFRWLADRSNSVKTIKGNLDRKPARRAAGGGTNAGQPFPDQKQCGHHARTPGTITITAVGRRLELDNQTSPEPVRSPSHLTDRRRGHQHGPSSSNRAKVTTAQQAPATLTLGVAVDGFSPSRTQAVTNGTRPLRHEDGDAGKLGWVFSNAGSSDLTRQPIGKASLRRLYRFTGWLLLLSM